MTDLSWFKSFQAFIKANLLRI